MRELTSPAPLGKPIPKMSAMDGIIGQDRALQQIQAALDSGRTHHGWVFHGPNGVGKFTAAWAFARVWLCPNAQPDLTGRVTACGACPSCNLIPQQPQLEIPETSDNSGDPSVSGHPDLCVVRKELARFSDDRATRERKLMTLPVGVLREYLLEPVTRKAQMGHGKVFIVDEAERLDLTGQNLLLKTLEEPPPGTLIILVTSMLDRLLPTIRSRCQLTSFTPLSDEQVRQVVEQSTRDDPEGAIDVSPELLTFACGSPGRAVLAAQYELDEWARVVLPGIDELMHGNSGAASMSLGTALSERIDGFAAAWVSNHKNASKDAANKQAAGLMMSMIANHARRQLSAQAASCDPDDPISAEHTLEPWAQVIDALGETEQLLGSNVNLGVACDHLVSRVSRLGMSAVASANGGGA